MSFSFSLNNSVIRSGLAMCTEVRNGDGGSMGWFSMSDSGSGSDADVDGVEGRGAHRQPKKLTLWVGMQPEEPAIVKGWICDGFAKGLDYLIECESWRVISRPRLME